MLIQNAEGRSVTEAWLVQGNATARKVAERRGAHGLKLTGAGTEFLFYSAHKGQQPEGYRIPRSLLFETANNPGVLALELQRKEMKLCMWATENGLPSSRPIDLIEQDDVPVLITEIINDDGSVISAGALGSLLADMHRLPPPESVQSNLKHQRNYAYIAARMSLRYEKLRVKNSLPLLPPRKRIDGILEESLHRSSLLHMDIRRQNIRSQHGQPLALFDWSNALIGAPDLEMARIEEYAAIAENGLDYSGILAGYLKSGGILNQSPMAWTLLRLDAALMLAGVFNSVAPDQTLEELFLARIRALLRTL